MVENLHKDSEEIFNKLPLTIQSYFITTGIAPEMEVRHEDYEKIHEGIERLTRNYPNLNKLCFEYLKLR